jgi:Holliday junction resolvase RusA-like endonuclease
MPYLNDGEDMEEEEVIDTPFELLAFIHLPLCPSVNHYLDYRAMGKRVIPYEMEETKRWKACVKEIIAKGKELGVITPHLIPKGHEIEFNTQIILADIYRRDMDNFGKLIKDAFTGIVYADDGQVTKSYETKVNNMTISGLIPMINSDKPEYRKEIERIFHKHEYSINEFLVVAILCDPETINSIRLNAIELKENLRRTSQAKDDIEL